MLSCACPCLVNAHNASMAFDGIKTKKGRGRDWKMMLQLCALYMVAPSCSGAATRWMVHHAVSHANKKKIKDMRLYEETTYCGHCCCPCLAGGCGCIVVVVVVVVVAAVYDVYGAVCVCG